MMPQMEGLLCPRNVVVQLHNMGRTRPTHTKTARQRREDRELQRQLLNDQAAMLTRCEARPITIQQSCNLPFTDNVRHITENIYSPAAEIVRTAAQEFASGCECSDCSNYVKSSDDHKNREKNSSCCPSLAGATFAYGGRGTCILQKNQSIYECNSACRCSTSCNNRIIQQGSRVPLHLFHRTLRGWGVQAVAKIPHGVFVAEYIGEVLPIADATGSSYAFELDAARVDDLEPQFVIDGSQKGNIARFFNHSCRPNLNVHPFWCGPVSPLLHRLVFFTNRRIAKGEELTVSYGERDAALLGCICDCRQEQCGLNQQNQDGSETDSDETALQSEMTPAGRELSLAAAQSCLLSFSTSLPGTSRTPVPRFFTPHVRQVSSREPDRVTRARPGSAPSRVMDRGSSPRRPTRPRDSTPSARRVLRDSPRLNSPTRPLKIRKRMDSPSF